MTSGEKMLWIALYHSYGGMRSVTLNDYDRLAILNKVYLDIIELEEFAERMDHDKELRDLPYVRMLNRVLIDPKITVHRGRD